MKFIYLTTALIALGAQSVNAEEGESWICPIFSQMKLTKAAPKYYIEAKTSMDTWGLEGKGFDSFPTMNAKKYLDGLATSSCGSHYCMVVGCKYMLDDGTHFTLIPSKIKELGYKCLVKKNEVASSETIHCNSDAVIRKNEIK